MKAARGTDVVDHLWTGRILSVVWALSLVLQAGCGSCGAKKAEAPEPTPEPVVFDESEEEEPPGPAFPAVPKRRTPVVRPAPANTSPKIDNQTRLASIMGAVDRTHEAVELNLSDSQKKKIGASSYAAYRTHDPALRVFLFEYGDPQEAAGHIQDVVVWINASGLVHNGEATLARHAIVVIGTEEPGDPDAAAKAAVDEYMDAAIMAE